MPGLLSAPNNSLKPMPIRGSASFQFRVAEIGMHANELEALIIRVTSEPARRLELITMLLRSRVAVPLGTSVPGSLI